MNPFPRKIIGSGIVLALLATSGLSAVDAPWYTIRREAASLSPDGRVLSVDTRNATRSWTVVLQTEKGILKPNTNYVVLLSVRTETPGESGYFHVLQRSLSNQGKDTLHQDLPGPFSRWTRQRIGFRTGGEPDPSFQIHVHKKLKGELRDLQLSEEFYADNRPMTADFESPGFSAATARPTGAKEFDVELPRNDGRSVSASDYGFSESNPDNTAALQKAIDDCRKRGIGTLNLAPGHYRFTRDDASLVFHEMKDFTFDGKGAVLIFHKKREPNFRISRCERMVFRNFVTDWDWDKDPLASLVKVVGNGKNSVDFKFIDYVKFPQQEVRVAVLSPYDPATGSVGVENSETHFFNIFPNRKRIPVQWLADNILRVRGISAPSKFRPGALFRMQHFYYDDMNGFVMDGNRHLTLEDVQIASCAGHAFEIFGKQKFWQFRRVRIAPRDRSRVITCTADHCHIARSNGFFKLEDSEFGLGADDCLNVHDVTCFAFPAGKRSLRILNRRIDAPNGTEVELRHADYSPTGVVAKTVGIAPAKTGNSCEIFFDRDLPAPSGDGFVLFDRTYDTRNIIIRNNVFHDNRARGLLLLGKDITVENNYFRHNEMGAIQCETGYTFQLWSEGYGVDNVVVRNNFFDTVNPTDNGHAGMAHDIYIGAYFRSDPSSEVHSHPVLSNLLFENNYFRNTFGLAAFIRDADGVTFSGNVFENTVSRKNPLPFRSGFYLGNARNVRLENNYFVTSPLARNPSARIDRDGKNTVRIKNNRTGEHPPFPPRIPSWFKELER